MLGLDGHSKEAGDEGDLPAAVSFAHPSDLSLANHVLHLVSLQRSPCRFNRKEPQPRQHLPQREASPTWEAGCCGSLMLVLIAVGLMNLPLTLLIIALVFLERVWEHGQRLRFF